MAQEVEHLDNNCEFKPQYHPKNEQNDSKKNNNVLKTNYQAS
jgi:hypothetical protein